MSVFEKFLRLSVERRVAQMRKWGSGVRVGQMCGGLLRGVSARVDGSRSRPYRIGAAKGKVAETASPGKRFLQACIRGRDARAPALRTRTANIPAKVTKSKILLSGAAVRRTRNRAFLTN